MAGTGSIRRKGSGSNALSIAVEGVVGAGKTTLAAALADRLGAVRLFEDEIDNPFLASFYKHRKRWALACQLYFLEARLRQFARHVPVGMPVVADQSLVKERIFAAVNLAGEEAELYRRCFERMAADCPFVPRVLIYLTASLEELRERIRVRGRRIEGAIDLGYLDELHHVYERWVEGEQAARQRIVVVSSDTSNIAQDAAAVDRLIEACLAAPVGLSYCNPAG